MTSKSRYGVFNFEGGYYAKTIRLSPDGEPEIYETTRRFATLLENVAIDTVTRHIDLDDASLTENTRAAYSISHIPNMTRAGMGGRDHRPLSSPRSGRRLSLPLKNRACGRAYGAPH